ncbi:snurportin-1-like [Saccoglossus kowalevskii]|uniref:Snurportin-1 n=1 Tax=Saccoglossus kowalevskii TaxID=10224 RepID=A0ABM0MYA4_SACKO|nr:PREDICTED: snurportin-1-like [Saccoglossus kowalevskii]
MEELTESLATSFQVSNIPNSTAAPHPRLLQYKLKSSAVDQEERRRRKLEQQKQLIAIAINVVVMTRGILSYAEPSKYTLLDCIYSEVNRTFYMLDVMCWRGVPVYDSDTEFRFYWMHTKFEDVPGLATHSNINPYKIIPLPYCSCKTEYIEKTMASPLPFEVQLDGILFYHKETHYTPGSTPLVGWLKPWMLPEILDVKVPKCYIESRPANSSLLPPSPSMDVTAPQSAAGDSTEKLLSSPVMDIAAPRSNVGDSIEKLLLSPAMDIAAPQSAAGDSTEKLLSSPVMVVTAPLTVVGDSNNAKTDLNEQNLSID